MSPPRKIITPLTYDDLYKKILKDLPRIKELRVDWVVGIARTGLIPATIIATELQLPLNVLYISPTGKGFLLLPTFMGRVLIVDDVARRGFTIKAAMDFCKPYASRIFTYTLYTERSTCKVVPTVSTFVDEHIDGWILFPWDRFEYDNPQTRYGYTRKTLTPLWCVDFDDTIVLHAPLTRKLSQALPFSLFHQLKTLWAKPNMTVIGLMRKIVRGDSQVWVVTNRPFADHFFVWLKLKLHRVPFHKLVCCGDLSGRVKLALLKMLPNVRYLDCDENVVKIYQAEGVNALCPNELLS